MELVRKIYYYDLDDTLQEEIARELLDENDPWDNLNQLELELYEYDPLNEDDLEILNDFLDQKISTEGEPETEHLDFYASNLSLLKKQPFLIIT